MKQSERLTGVEAGREISRAELMKLVPEDFDVNAARKYAKKERRVGFVG